MKNMKIGPLYATASLPIPSHHISSHSISYPFLSQNDEFLNRNLLEAIDKIMRVPSSWCCHRMTALWLVFVSFTILPEVTSFSSSASTRIPQEIKSSSTTSSQVGFYVHIPYCRRRCRYCNFAIVPIGNGNNDKPKASSSFLDVIHAQYQADLFQELDSLQPEASLSKIPLASIYFGGGTPSLAPVEMIQGVLQKIRSKFEVAANVEITMEMDPGTFDLAQLCALKELGMNRISLGVQSFDDTILEQLGRVHRRADIDEAVKMIHQVFGEESANYSMDLISGVPGLTEALWIDTLQTATNEFAASHLSIYDLQVEEGTVFGSWYHNNKENMLPSPSRIIPFLPTEDSVARMYKFTAGYLRAKGFEHYEVSSYAQRPSLASDPSRRSRHNQIYWASSSSWYAIGLGATSCVNGKIQARPKTMSDYHTWVEQLDDANNSLEATSQAMSAEDFLTDVIMKALRTSDGLDLTWVEQRFGTETKDTIVDGAKLGIELSMATLDSGGRRLKLRDPEGFLYSNYIISSIFAELGYG